MENSIKNKIGNKKIFLIISIALIIIFIIFMISNFKTDGMQNTKNVKISYKTYTEENGWSKWSKNGLPSGNYKNSIKNIKIKVKTDVSGFIDYGLYSNNKWNEYSNNSKDFKLGNIKGIRFYSGDSLNKKYSVCYRTYNSKNKWLEWSCDGYTNGNIDEDIKAIEIKIIPRNVKKNEWLKDYDKTSKKTKIGF